MEITGISFPSPLPRRFGKYTVLEAGRAPAKAP
jgi:hypothetical protein